jgi:triacylglycerol lipase
MTMCAPSRGTAGTELVTRGAATDWVTVGDPVCTVHHAPALPVLLVHGLGGTTSGWFAMIAALRARGVTVDAVSYSCFGTSVEHLAERVADAAAVLLNQTGAEKVHLVGHSLGGVVIAQALADGLLTGHVDIVVTIASPFGGSPWANLMPIGATVRALRRGSPQLQRLAQVPWSDGVRWLAIKASLDWVVPGSRSHPTGDEVEIVAVDGVGHVGLRLNRHVIDQVVATIAERRTTDRAAA